jgi:hypothetical protein
MPTYEVMTNDIGVKAIMRTDEDGTVYWIPMELTNKDYQEYLKSLEESSN